MPKFSWKSTKIILIKLLLRGDNFRSCFFCTVCKIWCDGVIKCRADLGHLPHFSSSEPSTQSSNPSHLQLIGTHLPSLQRNCTAVQADSEQLDSSERSPVPQSLSPSQYQFSGMHLPLFKQRNCFSLQDTPAKIKERKEQNKETEVFEKLFDRVPRVTLLKVAIRRPKPWYYWHK